jgi:hypothetical protein
MSGPFFTCRPVGFQEGHPGINDCRGQPVTDPSPTYNDHCSGQPPADPYKYQHQSSPQVPNPVQSEPQAKACIGATHVAPEIGPINQGLTGGLAPN